jgi:hypothetical protein
MRQALAQLEDSKIERERRRTYRGTARVRLEALHFRRNRPRELDRKHVEYLKRCFRKDGCRRLPKENHISAVIDQEHLDRAIRGSEISQADLLTNQPHHYAELVFPSGYQLECLHGQHRIQAAREVEILSPIDKWWTVDLYLAGIASPPAWLTS